MPTGCVTVSQAAEQLRRDRGFVRLLIHDGYLRTRTYYEAGRRGQRVRCFAIPIGGIVAYQRALYEGNGALEYLRKVNGR